MRLFGKDIIEGDYSKKESRQEINKIIEKMKSARVKVVEWYDYGCSLGWISKVLMEEKASGNQVLSKLTDAFSKYGEKVKSNIFVFENIPFWTKVRQARDNVYITMEAESGHPLLCSRRRYFVTVAGKYEITD